MASKKILCSYRCSCCSSWNAAEKWSKNCVRQSPSMNFTVALNFFDGFFFKWNSLLSNTYFSTWLSNFMIKIISLRVRSANIRSPWMEHWAFLSIIAYQWKIMRLYCFYPPQGGSIRGSVGRSVGQSVHPTFFGLTWFDLSDTAEGQASGTTNGQASGTADGQASGTADGQASGTADGQASGTADGQASGTAYGQTSGQVYGQASSQTDR